MVVVPLLPIGEFLDTQSLLLMLSMVVFADNRLIIMIDEIYSKDVRIYSSYLLFIRSLLKVNLRRSLRRVDRIFLCPEKFNNIVHSCNKLKNVVVVLFGRGKSRTENMNFTERCDVYILENFI